MYADLILRVRDERGAQGRTHVREVSVSVAVRALKSENGAELAVPVAGKGKMFALFDASANFAERSRFVTVEVVFKAHLVGVGGDVPTSRIILVAHGAALVQPPVSLGAANSGDHLAALSGAFIVPVDDDRRLARSRLPKAVHDVRVRAIFGMGGAYQDQVVYLARMKRNGLPTVSGDEVEAITVPVFQVAVARLRILVPVAVKANQFRVRGGAQERLGAQSGTETDF